MQCQYNTSPSHVAPVDINSTPRWLFALQPINVSNTQKDLPFICSSCYYSEAEEGSQQTFGGCLEMDGRRDDVNQDQTQKVEHADGNAQKYRETDQVKQIG